jgi:indolepyruvate ferredoxin oxidoreductase
MQRTISEATGEGRADFIDANGLATALMGDAIFGNLILLGHAWQQGLVPVSLAALQRAIELNGVAVEANLKAFLWGRRAGPRPRRVERYARPASVVELPRAQTLDDLIGRRAEIPHRLPGRRLRRPLPGPGGQGARGGSALGSTRLAEAVAKNHFKLLAMKDEYEVARLHADPAFRARIASVFEGDYRLNFHLAPPLLAKTDPATGLPRKRAYGPWMLTAFRWLAKLKFLRGGALDVFGRTAERRLERALIAEYERDVAEAPPPPRRSNLDTAVELAGLPEHIRGFGHIKLRSIDAARQKRAVLLAALPSTAGCRPRKAA